MVVLLQRHGDLAVGVDVDELGLGILGAICGEAGQVGANHAAAVHGAVGERHDRNPAARQLRERAVVDLLVALVLDRHRDEARRRVRRPRSRAGRRGRRTRSRPAGDVDCGEAARGLGQALAGVDADEGGAAARRHRGRLAVEDEAAQRRGRGRIGDVDEADRLVRAVAVDERHAVPARRDDLGGGGRGRSDALGQVRATGKPAMRSKNGSASAGAAAINGLPRQRGRRSWRGHGVGSPCDLPRLASAARMTSA